VYNFGPWDRIRLVVENDKLSKTGSNAQFLSAMSG